ncbi:MAG: peptidylprolyl isomerase [Gammaproteobacteria bacterium]
MKPDRCLRHALTISLVALGYAGSANATDVAVCTDLGNFTIELFDEQTPAHAANFLDYVDRGHYTGTVFHRVIAGFMVQGGGYNREFRNKPVSEPVMNESKNGVGNARGTLAAARTNDPHSATSQFFINLVDNVSLNAAGDGWGYSVFGRVSAGMDVIDAIAALPTGRGGPFPTDVTDPLVATTSMARIVGDRYPALSIDERRATLRQEIEAAAAAGDSATAAVRFGEYRAACGELGPDLLFTEANVLAAVGRNSAAIESLNEFLRVADSTSEMYLQAMTLSRQLADPNVAEARSAEQRRLDELAEDCVFPAKPTIPDGDVATMEQMVQGQGDIVAYMEESNELLECLDDLVDDRDLEEDDRELAIAAYNTAVEDQEDVAQRFNTQRELFLSQ